MEELDPRKHDVRDVDWESLWMVLLPYIAKDLGTDDRLDDLDPYLIRAVETDQNQECMQYLLILCHPYFLPKFVRVRLVRRWRDEIRY